MCKKENIEKDESHDKDGVWHIKVEREGWLLEL